jgi:uncharacterized circularly permuted ATP-grasp superfamily protein
MKQAFFSEMFERNGPAVAGVPALDFHRCGEARAHYHPFFSWMCAQSEQQMSNKRAEADLNFRRVGITFAVYGAKDATGVGTERTIPFDVIPRIFPAHEWAALEQGLRQRVGALNRFIHDIYHEQAIVRAGVIPAEQILANGQYRPQMQGVNVARDIYAHIAGIDIVRAGAGEFYVLEDNLRVPSGGTDHSRESVRRG